MRKPFTKTIILVVLITLAAGCGPAAPTAAPVSPTASPVPAMATAVLPAPTDTSLSPPAVPSATSMPAPLLLLENSPQLFGRTETLQVELGDLDGDGDLDAVLANMAANDSQVWFNDGAGQFIDSGQRLTQQGHGVALGDLDSDGDLDIFMTCAHFGSGGGWSKKPSRVYLNDGQGTFQDSGQDLGDTELSGNGVNLIDLDGDGDLDAHVIYYEVGGMADKVYLNDGAGRFSDSGLALEEEEIAWGDLDGDGDVDILAKAYGTGYRVLLNDGTGQFVTGWQMEDSQAMIGGLALADLDGDGDLDALLANGFRSEGSYPTRLLWNDGHGRFTDSGQKLNKTLAARFAVGDLDRDGSLDLFVSNADQRPGEAWLNDGAGRLVDSGLRLQSPSRHLATWPSLGDLDGDSDLDVVEAGFQGKAEVWLNKTPFSAVPPRNASLGDTWARLADGMTMVYVPGGEFQMGSDDDEVDAALEMCQAYYTTPCERAWFENEQPVHPVVLHGFWLDPTEVTNAQYRRCVEAGACSSPKQSDSDTRQTYYGDSAYDDYPVVHVTWDQADAYCRWAGGRLPTEAEWEWAARGPEGRRYPWGEEYDGTRLNSCDVNCGYEWAEDAFDDGYGDTAPVGSYPDGASWCGALNLTGNVWEWTADWYGDYPTGRQTNPAGPSSGTSRALRGDAADGTRAVSRAAARHGMKPGRAYEYTGFRCVVSAQPTDTPPPALATPPLPEPRSTPTSLLDNSGGVIAFYSERDGNAEIYTIRADGTGETRLTHNRALDVVPDLSPDGSQIVFVSDRDGNDEIYRMNRDGSGAVRLTDTPAQESYPFWSSDGAKIVFCSKRDDGSTFEVYLMNGDGTDQTRITNNSISEEWAYLSPDMQKIVYAVGPFPRYSIYVMNVDGSDPRQIFSSDKSAAFPKWSRDGRTIACNHATLSAGRIVGDVCLMNGDGSDLRQITQSPANTVSENPYWSPDGRRIVFQSNRTGNFQIYAMNADGSDPVRLTHHLGNDYWPSWGGTGSP